MQSGAGWKKEDRGNEKAYAIIENAAIVSIEPMGRKLAKLMKIPGMSSLSTRLTIERIANICRKPGQKPFVLFTA